MEREFIGVRINPPGVRWLETVADDITVQTGSRIWRTDVIRAALSVAKAHEDEVKAILRRNL